MTTLTFRVIAPTRFERMLLAASRLLAHSADARMRRRTAASRGLIAVHRDVADAQRDFSAPVRLGMLPR